MRKSTLFFASILVLLSSYHKGGKFVSRHFTIHTLAPGVWAAINNDEYGHAICNAGIIDLGDRTVVFDPFMNIDAAKDLRIAAMKLTKKPVAIVINSHYHNDHIRGNQVFVPGASIISTEWTRKEISKREPEEIAWEHKNASLRLADSKNKLKTAGGMEKKELPLWIGYYEGMVATDPILKITLPDITFQDSLWIYGRKTSIKLMECRDAHTGSDLVLMMPREGIVFMGDLLFTGRHPYLGDGSSVHLEEYLQKFEADNGYSRFVPGHGPVGNKTEIMALVKYLEDNRQLVQQGINQNLPDSVIIAKTALPETYQTWLFGRFYNANLELFCNELRKK
jgi:glyoxylase-like metal-dependent hydrolase (beta-lactamase superfamily II)